MTRLRGWLASPRAGLWLPLLAALLGLPALAGGLALDDLLLREQLTTGPGSAYQFIAGGADEVAEHRASGVFPWWAADDLRVRFFRPLAAATLAFDVRVSGAPWWMHLHGVLWSVLLAVVAGAAYRATVRRGGEAPWIAGLALLLFVVDDAHAASVGWISARHALVGATFAAAALLAHLRWRDAGWTPGALLGPAALALGLLASETALGALAYVAAHAWTLEPGEGWRARVLPLAPYVAVAAAWAAAYRLLGHGAAGCGVYVDPAADPLAFAGAALRHVPLLLTAQLGLPGVVELTPYVPGALAPAAALAALGLLACAWVLRPVWRGSPAARFWTLGMVLATLPVAGALPADRHLLLVGLGGSGLVAATLAAPRRGRLLGALAGVWLVVHGPLAALLAGPRALGPAVMHATLVRAADRLPASTRPVLLVQAPGDLFPLYAPALRGAGVHVLYAGAGPLELERRDARTLVLRPAGGWFAAPGDRVFRGADRPLRAGDRVALAGATLSVLEVDADGRPRAVVVRGDEPLDAGRWRWAAWAADGPAPLELPAPGGSRRLPPAVWRFE
jgi:hypothetical protein